MKLENVIIHAGDELTKQLIAYNAKLREENEALEESLYDIKDVINSCDPWGVTTEEIISLVKKGLTVCPNK